MGEVSLTINGKSYGVSCDDGQEQRLIDLGYYVDQRLKEIVKSGAGINENHVLLLTALTLSDEIFDLRQDLGSMDAQIRNGDNGAMHDEAEIAHAIETLAERIDHIAGRIQKA